MYYKKVVDEQRCGMEDGRWETEDGKWEMGDGRWMKDANDQKYLTRGISLTKFLYTLQSKVSTLLIF